MASDQFLPDDDQRIRQPHLSTFFLSFPVIRITVHCLHWWTWGKNYQIVYEIWKLNKPVFTQNTQNNVKYVFNTCKRDKFLLLLKLQS